MKSDHRGKKPDTPSPAIKTLLVFIAIILLPVIVIVEILYYLWGLVLSVLIWIIWGARGRNILFVYSDSPVWSGYIEQEILPHIQRKVVLLNWSKRKQWKPSLAVLAFRLFGGRRNFNPMAIVFRPFRLNKTFRFYEAFRKYKRGDAAELDKIKTDFLNSAR